MVSHPLQVCNAHHEHDARQQGHDLRHRLPEAGVLEELRDDRDRGDVDEAPSSERQDPRHR